MVAHSTPRSALKFDWGDIIATLLPWPLINSIYTYPPENKHSNGKSLELVMFSRYIIYTTYISMVMIGTRYLKSAL